MFVLDSDTSIFFLRGRSPGLAARLESIDEASLAITTISVAELRFGALRSRFPEENLVGVEGFVRRLKQLPFDGAAAERFARIRAGLTREAQAIGPMDMAIAAIVMSQEATLVTNNVREFSRVPGLRVENWATS